MFKKKELEQKSKPQIFATKNSNTLTVYNQSPQHNVLNQPKTEAQSSQPSPKQNFDMRRLKRAIYEFQVPVVPQNSDQQDQQKVPQRRQAVKMNVFRQSAREQQRQFHQQNHEYLRMFSVLAHSAINTEKFKIKDHREGYKMGQNKGQNKISKSTQNYATVHLQLQTQLTSSLINYKFPAKDIYNMVPFKRKSIELECRQFLDSKYEFFILEKGSQKIDEVRNNLKNVLQEGLTSEFKGSVIRTAGNLEYFEYLDLINLRQYNSRSKGMEYPKQILEIAQHSEVFEINSDQEQFYTKGEIKTQEVQTNQRMVSCEDFDLQQTAPSVYFQFTEDYALYKRYRAIEFKKLKIYDKDININSDIRNIISSQKIYLIELVKEIDLYIQLSTHPTDFLIMKEIYKQLRRKCEEFLKVLCNYTESKILKHYNIDNYHEKIMMFIEKSIKYNKEIIQIQPQILTEFPILKIWYEIPKILFGYSRDKLHLKYYDLVRAMLFYQDKIKDYELQKKLSIKRPNVNYAE